MSKHGWNGLPAACVILALATGVLYWPATRNDFVSLDDPDYYTQNATVQQGLTWEGVRWAFQAGHAGNWHPVTWISHMTDAALWGNRAAGPHAVNVVLHAVNSGLLLALLAGLTGSRGRSLAVAALFAAHPLHVESVAWISERKDVLCAGFGLLALIAYAKYANAERGVRSAERRLDTSPGSTSSGLRRPSPVPPGHPLPSDGRGKSPQRGEGNLHDRGDDAPSSIFHPLSSRWYWVALLCFALGLMSKPMLVTWPAVMLLLDIWPLRRVAKMEDGGWRMEVARWRPLIIEKLPFLALVAASCVVTVIAQERGGAVHTLADTSLTQRLGNAVVSYARYVIKTVWPADMAVPYPHPGHWPVGVILMSGLLLAGITAAVILARRRCPAAGFGWLWFLGTLVPVIGLVQVGSQSMADRYFYVPGIGLLIAAVWGVGHCVAGLESRWTRGAVRLLTLGVVAGLGWRTSAQIRVWRDTETLFQHAVRVTEGNYIAHYSLGHFYQSKGRRAEALEHYLRTTELKPQHPDAWNNLGVLKTEELRFNEALPYFWNALKHKPQDGEFRTNVYRCAVIAGKELAKSGDLAGATPLFRSAVELMPEAFDARNALGSALGMSGDTVGAVEQFRAALKARPDSVTAHQNLGRALMNLGQTEEGEAHLKRAAALMERPGT